MYRSAASDVAAEPKKKKSFEEGLMDKDMGLSKSMADSNAAMKQSDAEGEAKNEAIAESIKRRRAERMRSSV